MKKNFITCLAMMIAVGGWAQANQQPNSYTFTVASTVQSNLRFNNLYPNTYCEGPPAIVQGGWHSYFFSTHFSRHIASPTSIADDNLEAINMSNAYGNDIVTTSLVWWNGYKLPHAVLATGNQWSRNYNGVGGAHPISTSAKGNLIVAISHCENKNEIAHRNGNEEVQYNNTVWPEKVIDLNNPDTYSGYSGGEYKDGYLTYFGFITASWLPNTEATNWGHGYFNEEGPIVWPSNGYLTPDRKKASLGVRHPSSMVYGGYLYVYYLDTRTTEVPWEEGREFGIKVMRAPVNEAWNYKAYQVYYNGGWQSSLPAGYTKETMPNYYTVKGPKSTPMFYDAGHNIVKFTVAKLRNTNFFIGMEEYNDDNDGGKNKVVFRISMDLVHWSSVKYTVSTAATFNLGKYHGPLFMDKGGWTNSEIDADKFYIYGTSTTATDRINRMRFNNVAIGVPATTGTGPGGTGGGCAGCGVGAENTEQKDINIEIYQSEDKLYVSTNENSSKKVISVYSLLGELVHQETIEGNHSDQFDVPLTHFNNKGIYILTIDANNKRFTKKIYIQ